MLLCLRVSIFLLLVSGSFDTISIYFNFVLHIYLNFTLFKFYFTCIFLVYIILILFYIISIYFYIHKITFQAFLVYFTCFHFLFNVILFLFYPIWHHLLLMSSLFDLSIGFYFLINRYFVYFVSFVFFVYFVYLFCSNAFCHCIISHAISLVTFHHTDLILFSLVFLWAVVYTSLLLNFIRNIYRCASTSVATATWQFRLLGNPASTQRCVSCVQHRCIRFTL